MAGRLESWPASDVDGKVALIHGGNGDEGLKLAREFVIRGCRVVLVESSLSEFTRATQIGDPLPHFAFPCSEGVTSEQALLDSVRRIQLDVTAGEEVYSQAVEEAWGIFGNIGILINCNSVPATVKPFLETTEKDYDRIMEINVKSSWKLSKAVARKMREAESGSIIFITSISGTERGHYPGVSMYGTSMAAIHHLTKMMALELGKYGIRVNAVSCGLSSENDLFEAKDDGTVQELARKVVPLQRWSNFPDDIMGVVLWLAGDLSTFVTGTISVVDGGQSLSRPRLSSYL